MTASVRRRYEISTQEPTRYEVILERGSVVLDVLGFTQRLGRPGLMGYIRSNGERIMALLPADSMLTWSGGAIGARATMTPDLVVRFSGRTEREAAQ